MVYLSSNASTIFLDIVRINYINQQEILAIRAKKDMRLNEAVYHYSNIIAAKEHPDFFSFDGLKKWNLFFPFEAVVLKEINSTNYPQGYRIDIGISHGRLANALEMAGLLEEAEKEYNKASLLIHTSPENVKKLITDSRYDEGMLKRN